MRRQWLILSILWLTVNLLDAATTVFVLSTWPGIAIELNPLFNAIGWLPSMLYKLALTIAAPLFWRLFPRKHMLFGMTAAIATILLAVASNSYTIAFLQHHFPR